MDRETVLEALAIDVREEPDRFRGLVGAPDLPGPERFDGEGVPDWAGMVPRERRLVWKVWALESAPFGVTLSGAAYEDNPIRYANRRFRELTGYSMADLRGENPRLLQGPETERAAVSTLHEALRGWSPVTVELWNYRADSTRFRNRVSLLPMADSTGTVTHWYGVQERVG